MSANNNNEYNKNLIDIMNRQILGDDVDNLDKNYTGTWAKDSEGKPQEVDWEFIKQNAEEFSKAIVLIPDIKGFLMFKIDADFAKSIITYNKTHEKYKDWGKVPPVVKT